VDDTIAFWFLVAFTVFGVYRARKIWRAETLDDPEIAAPPWWPYQDGLWLRIGRAAPVSAPTLAILVAIRIVLEAEGQSVDSITVVIAVLLFVAGPFLAFTGIPSFLVPPVLRNEDEWIE
jgi:hypothetical protein